LGDLVVDGSIILKGCSRNRMRVHKLNRFDSGYGEVTDAFEWGNEISRFVKCWEFLDWLRNG
jgi:hypothetical protein